MKLFGWKSAGRGMLRPAKTHVSLTRAFAGGVIGEWPKSYEAQLREGYLNNVVAQRAVRLVAEGMASVPLSASDDAALALVKATSGGQSLLETLAAQLLLHGNGYVQLLTASDGTVCELYALRPERVSVEADARGWPAAFRYKAGEAVTRLAANEIIHIRTHHPLDDHYGLGCLGAASGAIAIHNASTRWNKALLDNAARPSGALVHEAAEALSGEQFDRLQEELKRSFSGQDNAGRPMLLEGGLKWQMLSLTPADMDFAGLKAAAAREIALAFGVPPMLLGLPGDATYANYREANKALWRQAILPLAGKILDALAEGLRPWFADLALAVDIDQVSALSEDRERLWAQVAGADFLTLEEKRAVAGFDALPENAAVLQSEEENKTGILELKYNPWHDTEDGEFTFAGQGRNFGGNGKDRFKAGGSPKGFGGGGAEGPIPEEAFEPKTGSRGGTVRGGGASGSWDKPNPQPNKPIAQPRREITKPKIPSAPAAKPEAAPKIHTIKSGGYNFDVDVSNRTVRAYGQLRLQPDQPRSRSAQRKAGKPDRLPKDHGGHFIGRQFGGPEISYNHFAQNARFNNSEYKKLENEWKGHLKAGRKVRVDIRADYQGNSKRPYQLRIRYYINGKRREKQIPNLK
jgi:HK97 family phage portal protein